jgi:Fe-S-cluster containining protein
VSDTAPLETELARARALQVSALADAIESIGFECTRCGACCTAHETDDGERESHTATVFPDEVRRLRGAADGTAPDDAADAAGDSKNAAGDPEDATDGWRDVAQPMPYGIESGPDGPAGETFEWALQTDACGDCAFYEESDGTGACTVHDDRPLICATYPFSVALGGTTQPMGEVVDSAGPEVPRADGTAGDGSVDAEGMVRAHECEGLGRDISRADAEELAATLKQRAIRELEEAIAVRDAYEPVDPGAHGGVVVHDSEGAKRPDGTPLGGE